MRGRSLAAAVLAAVVLAGCGDGKSGADGASGTTPTRAAAAPAPAGFVGLVASEVIQQSPTEQEATFKEQAAAGVEVFRQTFPWNEIEPREGDFAFGLHDQLVASAAKAGVQILPIIFNVRPGQGAEPKRGVTITDTTTMPPKDPATFAGFASVLVKRYGRGGTFWKEHPELPARPMTSWQVWNEPNLKAYWGGRPNQVEYTALLRATGAAIHAVDPRAEIVTGGIPQSRQGIPLKTYISLLARAHARGTFDTLAIHPYAKDADGVLLGAEGAREALDDAGLQDVNLWITEVGWATGGPPSAFTVSRRQQGELISELLHRATTLAPRLKLRGIVFYGWRDLDPCTGCKDFWGNYTGLLSKAGRPKPALRSFSDAAHEIRSSTS